MTAMSSNPAETGRSVRQCHPQMFANQRIATPDSQRFSRRNIAEIDEFVTLMESLKITLWSVFFLVPTGRGKLNDLLSAEEFESVFAKVYSLSKTASFDIKTTEV
jgi:hypothetical protein